MRVWVHASFVYGRVRQARGLVGHAPTVLSFAAAFALPAPERALLAFVSIFLKKGAFFRMSGSTMKRTWLPRKKQLRSQG